MRIVKRYIPTSSFPYAIEIQPSTDDDFDLLDDVYTWCVENFGSPTPDGSAADYKWIKSLFGLRFKHESHANWLIMRFST